MRGIAVWRFSFFCFENRKRRSKSLERRFSTKKRNLKILTTHCSPLKAHRLFPKQP